MSRLSLDDDRVHLDFSRTEKVMGLVRDLDLPVDRIVSVDPLERPWWRAVRGWRVGFSLPAVRLLGTWRWRGRRQLVDLRRGMPSLRLVLTPGAAYDEVLVSSPAAPEHVERIRERISG